MIAAVIKIKGSAIQTIVFNDDLVSYFTRFAVTACNSLLFIWYLQACDKMMKTLRSVEHF